MSHIDGAAPSEASIDEVITTVVMARVTDYFGFFVYAIASALVFPALFFPSYPPLQGLLLSFAIFSLAFLVRPFASLAARGVQRHIGQFARITLALVIFMVSTAAIGLLPGFDKIGWLAPALLALLRLGQGIGMGGGWDGLTLRLQLSAPENRVGTYSMLPQLGGPIGFIVAASLFFVLHGFLTPEEFIQWGWRFAFFAVMAVSVVSLFARLRLLSTHFGVDASEGDAAPLGALLRTQSRGLLLSTFLPLASYALFHIVTVFPLGYVTLYSDFDIASLLLWQLLGGVLGVCAVIASGVLADRYGRRRVIAVSTGLIVALCLTLGSLDSHPGSFVVLGFIVLGLAFGQAGAIVSNRFPPEFRYAGSALATNLSWITGAAFAPLAAMALAASFGLWAVSLYLLSGVVVTFLSLAFLTGTDRS